MSKPLPNDFSHAATILNLIVDTKNLLRYFTELLLIRAIMLDLALDLYIVNIVATCGYLNN